MRIALTGVTGLLGRNLLFEVLKQNIDKLDNLEILAFGRPQKNYPLKNRLDDIIKDDGQYYIGLNPKSSLKIIEKIDKCIIPIPFDLTKNDLGISKDNLEILKKGKIDYFFHIAALTDFRSGKSIAEKLEKVNVEGTKNLLALIGELNVNEAVYIGSAYSCGDVTGNIKPDHINLESNFRNPYERSKLVAEIEFRKYTEKNKLKYKIFRPSTIGGRLVEKPIGAICKYDVFYGWAAFFFREKLKQVPLDKIYVASYKMPMRILYNPRGGLNIVPADYASKIIYGACINNEPYKDYHLTNSEQTPNKLYGDVTFEALKIEGIEYVEVEPKEKNHIEALYYRTVGKLFTPYGLSDPIIFDVSNLVDIEKKMGLKCPPVDKDNYLKLLNYAMKNHFGLVGK